MSKYSELRETLADALATAYKMPTDEANTLIPENEDDFSAEEFHKSFLELDKKRISDIGQRGKDQFDDGYKKAQKETLSKYESSIKTEYGIDEDLQGMELIKKVIELNSKTTEGASKFEELSEDEVKKHPSVIALMQKRDDREKAIEKEWSDKLSEVENQTKRKELFSKVTKKALEVFNSLNPILSEDPERANNQKEVFLNQIKAFDYQETENGFIPLEDGKPKENAHGHQVAFEDLIKEKASSLFDFKAGEQRDTPPTDDRKDDKGNKGYNGQMPKTEDEYMNIVLDKNIPLEERQKVSEYWEKNQAS